MVVSGRFYPAIPAGWPSQGLAGRNDPVQHARIVRYLRKQRLQRMAIRLRSQAQGIGFSEVQPQGPAILVVLLAAYGADFVQARAQAAGGRRQPQFEPE